MTRQFVESTVNMARNLWQIEKEEEAEKRTER